MHLIAGAVYAQHGGQWDEADSESKAGAGAHSHLRARHGGQRAATDSESGARDGAPAPLSAHVAGRGPTRPGPGPPPVRDSDSLRARTDRQSVGRLRQTLCRRCRQSGRRGPAVRQVWGTDSDTSRRRRGRRSRPEPRAAGPARHDFPRARFVRVQSARGPRLPVCLDVARPSHLHLPPFPAPRVKHVIPLHPCCTQ